MLVDTALSRRWNAWMDAQLPQPHGVHVGARPASQSLHIAHALHLVLERGLDSDNGTAVGQSDIRSYFDALPALKIAEWMMDRGALPADVATLVRFQMMPAVRLHIGYGTSISIAHRSKGGLTGTRTALVLARIPVEATVSKLYRQLRPFGLPVANGGSLLVATYIENFYVVAPSQAFAIHSMEAIEEELVSQWGLEAKQSSRQSSWRRRAGLPLPLVRPDGHL